MATPVAVPFVRSSNFDCSQVRVPSAKAAVGRTPITNREARRMLKAVEKETLRGLRNVVPRFKSDPETPSYAPHPIELEDFRLTRRQDQSRDSMRVALGQWGQPARHSRKHGIVDFHGFCPSQTAKYASTQV